MRGNVLISLSYLQLSSFSGACQVALVVKNPPANAGNIMNHGFDSRVRKILWRRKWPLTPVFLPEESYGQRSLAGCSPHVGRVKHNWSDSVHAHPAFPTPLAKQTVFFPWYIIAFSVKDFLTIRVWVYFWAFYSVPLIHMSVFVPVLCSFDYCSFVALSESYASRFVPFPQDCCSNSRAFYGSL